MCIISNESEKSCCTCTEYVYLFYLNDVNEGGETEFLHCGVSLKPVKGTLVYFPTNFPFVHRGNVPISSDKYIVTGWMSLKKA